MTKYPQVKELMIRNVVTVDCETSVEEACKIMGDRHIGSLIVTKDRKPYGLFTERDLLSKVISKGADLKKLKVKDFTSSPLITIKPETSLFEASRIMSKMHIRRLPVFDTQGRLVGIFTSADVPTGVTKLLEFKET